MEVIDFENNRRNYQDRAHYKVCFIVQLHIYHGPYWSEAERWPHSNPPLIVCGVISSAQAVGFHRYS